MSGISGLHDVLDPGGTTLPFVGSHWQTEEAKEDVAASRAASNGRTRAIGSNNFATKEIEGYSFFAITNREVIVLPASTTSEFSNKSVSLRCSTF